MPTYATRDMYLPTTDSLIPTYQYNVLLLKI